MTGRIYTPRIFIRVLNILLLEDNTSLLLEDDTELKLEG